MHTRYLVVSFLLLAVQFPLYVQELPIEYRSGTYITDRSPQSEYKARRDRLMDRVRDGIVVLTGRGDDRGYGDVGTFRQENNFFYFTGLEIPNAVLFLLPAERKEILFIPERNLPIERWTGPKLGPGPDAREFTGISDIRSTQAGEITIDARRRPVPDWRRTLASYLNRGEILSLILSGSNSYEHRLASELREEIPALTVRNIIDDVVDLRRNKSPEELRLTQHAIDITLEAHREVAGKIGPGIYEYEVQALLEYIFRKSGAEGPAFPSIVGSGFYSTVLHYDQSIRRMEAGDLVVVDIGARYGFYCADITRTYPVSGSFTPRQREIYDVVLGAHIAVAEQLRPGLTIFDLRKIAFNHINSQGQDAAGNPLGSYFIHGVSHFVGLQVHDVGSEETPLRPGDVITIEPGIYIPDEDIGIRIEDMYLLTESGSIRLSRELPRSAEQIEQLMQR